MVLKQYGSFYIPELVEISRPEYYQQHIEFLEYPSMLKVIYSHIIKYF